MAYDFERGAKTTGSKFYFNRGNSAVLEWNLMTFMINFHITHGYTFIIPPYLINKVTAKQAGILDRFEESYYETTDGLILIPTAETPLVGLYSQEIFKKEALPMKLVAFSPCFRKEAGGYGAKNAGLKRVRQFHKIELFNISTKEDSYKLHDEMVSHIENLIKAIIEKFKTPLEYRLVELSETDRSPISKKTIDIEMKYGDEWLEVSSISNTEDTQSKIAMIRYKDMIAKKNEKVHLLNGSGLALPRLILCMGGTP